MCEPSWHIYALMEQLQNDKMLYSIMGLPEHVALVVNATMRGWASEFMGIDTQWSKCMGIGT